MKKGKQMLGAYVRALGEIMYKEERYATARHYVAAAKSLLEYLGKTDFPIAAVSQVTIEGYNSRLRARGLCPNTLSFYNRNLRALFNRVKPGWGTSLFKDVFTGNDITLKRAVSVQVVRELQAKTDLSAQEQLARDIFLFSIYTCGISFVDLVYLKPENLQDGHLVYIRRKTGHRMAVQLSSPMQAILNRYALHSHGYLFPFLDVRLSSRQNYDRYCCALTLYNRSLKQLGRRVGLSLTSYVARHTWASVAYREAGSPVPVISAALGHCSERTTRIYLAGLDHRKVDALQENVQRILDGSPGKEKSLALGKRQISNCKLIHFQGNIQAFPR